MIKINIEYCIKWNYKPEFDRVSKIIKNIASNAIITDNITPPRTGSFEVTLNDRLVYSKFSSGDFPKKPEIYSWFE